MTQTAIFVGGFVTGIASYVAGQIISKLFIEPIYELRKTIGKVGFDLDFYGKVIYHHALRNNPQGTSITADQEDAAQALWKVACDLASRAQAVPLYKYSCYFFAFGELPGKRQDIDDAVAALKALSHSVCNDTLIANSPEEKDAVAYRDAEIRALLKIGQRPKNEVGY